MIGYQNLVLPDSDERKNSMQTMQTPQHNEPLQILENIQIQPPIDLPSTSAYSDTLFRSSIPAADADKLPRTEKTNDGLKENNIPMHATNLNTSIDSSPGKRNISAKRPCLSRVEWDSKIRKITDRKSKDTIIENAEKTFNAAVREILNDDGKQTPLNRFDVFGRYVAAVLNDMDKDSFRETIDSNPA